MRKVLTLVILLFMPMISVAETWSDVRQTGFGNTITFSSPEYELSISWSDRIVAGEMLLFTVEEHKDMKIKSYRNYDFDGIQNDSLRVNVRGADSTPKSPSAKDDPSIADTYYLESFSDSSFYFIATEIKGRASLRVTASNEYPGAYDVQFLRVK